MADFSLTTFASKGNSYNIQVNYLKLKMLSLLLLKVKHLWASKPRME